MKFTTCSLLLISLLTQLAVAQKRSAKDLGIALDPVIPSLLQKYDEPGVAVAYIDGCKVVLVRTYGASNVADKKPITPQTYFQMGSISKTLTAWAVMLLVKRGKIALDDPVEKYLRRWKLPDSQYDSREVTVHRLLNHTAGISVPSVSGTSYGNAVPSIVDELKGLGTSGEPVKLIATPGEKYNYSGGGYSILQLLVDVSGISFNKFMQKELLKPLKLNSTYFGWNKNVAKEVATPYKAGTKETYDQRLFSSLAAAGMYSTIEDMGSFLTKQCFDDNQQPDNPLLDRAALREMMSGTAASPQYGFGYQVYPPVNSTPIVGNSGSNLGWKSNFMLVPSKGLGIVVLTNAAEGKTRLDILKAFRDLVIERIKQE